MKPLHLIGALLLAACTLPTATFAQMQYYQASSFGSRFNDINDNGVAVSGGAYFDHPTLTWTPMEPEAVELVSINNDGDVAGSMWFDEDLFLFQPAVKTNGVWTPIGWFPASNPVESFYSTFSISPNGVWVTGQMSIGCCTFGTFLYNTQTGVLTEIFSPDYVAVAGYFVTNDGTIGGWADDQFMGGTRRIPVYITPDLQIVQVSPTPPEFNVNAVNAINASSLMVGDFDNQPFVYDLNTNSFTTFNIPFGYIAATFTSVSDNGVAVGYAQQFGEFGSLVRDAIVYHPDLGSQPLFLKDILLINGIDINSPSGRMGTAIAISPSGQYIAGWADQAPFIANGWIVYLNDLLFEEPACTMVCPGAIEVIADQGQTTAVVDYEVTFTCGPNAPDGVELVLVSGPASGSEFPFGTTPVTHHLVDDAGDFVNACTFLIIVSDQFCTPQIQFFVEPITRVVVAGVDNASTADPSAPGHEFFLDVEIGMNISTSYPISLEGYTGGDFINFFTVFVDFDQDGEFNTGDEMFEIGSIENSSGLDGQAATGTIDVPANALTGVTRMRVIKSYESSPIDPCGGYPFGQVEDYTVIISDLGTGLAEGEDPTISVFPNPATDVLRIEAAMSIGWITLYNHSGQVVVQQDLQSTAGTIDLSALSGGVYALHLMVNNANHVFKVVKY